MNINLKNIKTHEALKKAKNLFYGPTSPLAKLKKELKNASQDQKPIIGRQISQLIQKTEAEFLKINQAIEAQKIAWRLKTEKVSLKTPTNQKASLHPLSLIASRASTWLTSHGYYQTQAFEIESDKFNFENLNIDADHPAREMHDTLYLDSKMLLRTHNTSLTARELQKRKNQSFGQFSIGNVYRNDEDDATHSHQFFQLDLVAVGEYGLHHLLWTIKKLLKYLLEDDLPIRVRNSYFPFTQPSIEIDIKINDQWIEVLGGGVVRQEVLKMAGYTNNMSAYAAGIGLDRIAMLKYQIDDIRQLYKNDLRFLKQFNEGE